MKVALSLSGGGAKGAFEAGFIKGILRKVDEFVCSFGNSTGSLISTLVAQKNWNLMTRLYTKIKTGNIIEPILWKDIPILPDLLPPPDIAESALLAAAIIAGRPSIYNIDPLMKIIDDNVDFDDIKDSDCEVGYLTTEWGSMQPKFFSSKSRISAKTLRKALEASISMPIFMPPVKIKGQTGRYVDGGLYKHIPGTEILNAKRINEADVVILVATCPKYPDTTGKVTKEMVDNIVHTLLGLSDSNDVNSLALEYRRVKEALTTQKLILVQPDKPLPVAHSLRFVPEEMKAAYDIGMQKAKEVNKLL